MKYLSIIRYVLITASVVLLLLGAINDPGMEAGGSHPWVDAMLRWTYVIFGIAVVIVAVMAVFSISQNPKGAKRSLLGVAILAVIVAISWALADTSPVYIEGGKTLYDNVANLKIAGAELILAYIVFAATILAIIGGEVYKTFKK